MKRKATLLIQHLEVIYTLMGSVSTFPHHAFIALYHDEIIALGEGEGEPFIDKDTRILEGRGHIAIPAFIDIDMSLPSASFQGIPNQGEAQALANILANTTQLLRHGTLLANLAMPLTTQEQRLLQAYQHPTGVSFTKVSLPSIPIYRVLTKHSAIPDTTPFCISCDTLHSNVLDQLLCAKLIANQSSFSAIDILKACTLYPAQALGLPRLGCLAVGKIANILLLEGNDITQILTRFHGDERIQAINEGVRIFPNRLI